MGEKVKKQELTLYDIVTVLFYRFGIIIAAVSFIYFVRFTYLYQESRLSGIFTPEIAPFVFWLFIVAVNVSVSFLHLYSKRVLNIIRLMTYSGTMILLALLALNYLDYELIFKSSGWQGKAGVIGLGLVLAGFSGIGAKEAFCFKLYEGYAYGISLGILVIAHLLGLLNFYNGYIPLLFIAALVTIFTLRKLLLPLYYDIGDKSRY
jgi:uncharacterized integral membrane protein